MKNKKGKKIKTKNRKSLSQEIFNFSKFHEFIERLKNIIFTIVCYLIFRCNHKFNLKLIFFLNLKLK